MPSDQDINAGLQVLEAVEFLLDQVHKGATDPTVSSIAGTHKFLVKEFHDNIKAAITPTSPAQLAKDHDAAAAEKAANSNLPAGLKEFVPAANPGKLSPAQLAASEKEAEVAQEHRDDALAAQEQNISAPHNPPGPPTK
jgi:hypothetical protein